MDRALRPNHIVGEYGPGSGSKIARQLVRVDAGLGTLVLMLLAWHLLSAHGAVVNLRAAAKAQAVVTIAVTKPQPLSGFVELVLPGNEKANYEAPIYARTSGYLKCWLVDIGTTNAMTPVSRTI